MKIDFEVGNCVPMNLFLVLLGSNSTELLWFKEGWFPLFLQLRGKWCLLILGVFPKTMLIIKLFYIKEICWYSIYKLIFYRCLMCTLIIRFMKNLWDSLNLFKFVCVNIFLYFWELWINYFCEHLEWIIYVSIL